MLIGADRPTLAAGDLARPVPPLTSYATSEEARDLFNRDHTLLSIAVVDAEGAPVGLVNRFRFLERLAARFGRELTLTKPVVQFMDDMPLILDAATHIDELGTRLIEEQQRYAFDGFIVTRNGRYDGLGTGLDLIRVLTERRHEELARMALHDPLTGLPNRTLFENTLRDTLAGKTPGRFAIMFVDLDRFKEINDTFGHRFGDRVLCGISQRLRGALRRSDVVARLSGDEFAAIARNIQGGDEAVGLARALLDSCRAPLSIDDHTTVVSCSIGIALYPDHGTTVEALLHAADAAQYHAKEVRNRSHCFNPELLTWRTPSAGLGALRGAIDADALDVHYQPIIDLANGRVSAVEALVRWPHGGSDAGAAHIVHLAEESGLIVPLAELVMRKAMRQLRRWDLTTGRTDLRLALNVSAVQISDGGLLDVVDRAAAECGFDLARLDLELTERASMCASTSSLSLLHALRARGITLTIDDFGTGYSALSRLDGLPIDAMKIDKVFLERVANPRQGVIARAIIAMGHALGLVVVGEGVETTEQLAFLKQYGCDYAQGFLLARPVPGESLHGLLVQGISEGPHAALISSSVSTVDDVFAAWKMRSTRSSPASRPRDSSQ